MAQWYYQKNGNVKGPITFEELSAMVKGGELQLSDLVYKDGDVRWQVLIEVSGIEKRSGVSPSLKSHVNFPDIDELKDRHWIVLLKQVHERETRFIQKGPFDAATIRTMLNAAEIEYGDFAWRPGFEDWQHIGALKEFDRRGREVEREERIDPNKVAPKTPVKNEWITPDEKPPEAEGEDLVADSGVKSLIPPKPKLPPQPVPQKIQESKSTEDEETQIGKNIKELAAQSENPKAEEKPEPKAEVKPDPKKNAAPEKPKIPSRKEIPQTVVARKAERESPLKKEPGPKMQPQPFVERRKQPRHSVPFGVPQKQRAMAAEFSRSIADNLGPIKEVLQKIQAFHIQVGTQKISAWVLLVIVAFCVALIYQQQKPESKSEKSQVASLPQYEELPAEVPVQRPSRAVRKPIREPSKKVAGRRSRAGERNNTIRRQPASIDQNISGDVAAPLQEAPAPVQVSGRDSFIKLSELTSKHMVIHSDAPVGAPLLLTLEGKTGQVLDSPGFYASRTLKQKSSGKFRINYAKEKIPPGAYLLEVKTDRQRIARNIHVGGRKEHQKRLRSERKRWSYQRNREKQKLFYRAKELENIMNQLAARKITGARALSKLSGMKTEEVWVARKNVIRNLAYPTKWKRLRDYVFTAEKLVKEQGGQKRIMASDSARKLRAQISSLKAQAGSLSAY